MLRTYEPAATPETSALAALMCLHAARLPARMTEGALNPLVEQDRTAWDAALTREGLLLLEHSAAGEAVSPYHVEAAIAAVLRSGLGVPLPCACAILRPVAGCAYPTATAASESRPLQSEAPTHAIQRAGWSLLAHLLGCAFALAVLGLGRPALAEDEQSPTASPEEPDYLALADAPAFLPRSYFYWGTPAGSKGNRAPLVFALTYALHLPAYNNLREQALRGKSWAGAATLSFEGDLRMLSVRSRPVRMPSYRPTLSGQLFYLLHGELPTLFGARLAFFHYSNGQERCTYDDQLSDDSDDCKQRTARVEQPRLELNRKTGNFTMNGWTLEFYARMHQLSATRVAIAQLAVGLSVSGNLPLGDSRMDAVTRHLYGWGRLGAEIDARRRFGWASIGARAAAYYFPDSGPSIPPAAGMVELTIGPYWLTGFGFFVRYYGGRDSYNAFFVDSIQQFATGLSWDGERPLKFAREAHDDDRQAEQSMREVLDKAERESPSPR